MNLFKNRGEFMSIITEINDAIHQAKKKYDKEKYITTLERQIELLEQEIEKLQGQNLSLSRNTITLNSNHLKLFKLVKDNNYSYSEHSLREYAKTNIDLEIALSELIENGYFEHSNVASYIYGARLEVPEEKKIELLNALKFEDNDQSL